MTPYTCLRGDHNDVFGLNMIADITIGNNHYPNINIGILPLMVKTNLCDMYMTMFDLANDRDYEMDHGGYFVIGTNRYVIISQESSAYDVVHVTRNDTPPPISTRLQHLPTISYQLKFRSLCWTAHVLQDTKQIHITLLQGSTPDHQKYNIKDLLDAYDISINEVLSTCTVDTDVSVNFVDLRNNKSRTSTRDNNTNRNTITETLKKTIANMCTPSDPKKTLALLFKRFIFVIIGKLKVDDSYGMQFTNVLTPIELLKKLLKQEITGLLRRMVKVHTKVEPITKAVKLALQSGNWAKQSGLTTLMHSDNTLDMLSTYRRITSPLVRSDGISNIKLERFVQPMSFGRTCPIETATSERTGLVRYLAYGARISSYCFTQERVTILQNFLTRSTGNHHQSQRITIWINGVLTDFECCGENVDEFILAFRKYRSAISQSAMGPQLSDISFEWCPELSELRFRTTGGRILRRLKNLCLGVVEWVDASEEQHLTVDLVDEPTPTRSHQEVSTNYALGVSASANVFVNHSLGPRTTFQSNMDKQAACQMPIMERRGLHLDNKLYLSYVQRPLVTTPVMVEINQTLPQAESTGGVNAIGQYALMAILSYEGYGQEDSIIISKGFIDRLAFRAVKTSVSSAQTTTATACVHAPDELPLIDPMTRVAKVGSVTNVSNPTVILTSKGKVNIHHASVRRAGSHTRVMDAYKGRHNTIVRVSELFDVAVGDKFSMMGGQKATVGRIVPVVDLPFTADGLVPDIIFNPHSLPTRMTPSVLIEALVNKAMALSGQASKVRDLFVQFDICDDQLYQHTSCKQVMTCGRTGNQFESNILVAPIYWKRLKHIASEKSNVRGIHGLMNITTHQPLKGRAARGGVMHSEQENWCALAHNAKEYIRSVNACDMSFIEYDKEDGIPLKSHRIRGVKGRLECPHSLSLLVDRLTCLHIQPIIKDHEVL